MPDVSLIERIEVVKGHGGALYGSDAVGGVINIITKKMDHSYGKVSMGFGSHQARDAKAMYTIKEGKTGVMVAASKYKQGYHEYKDAKTEANKRWPAASTYENEKVSVKLSQELSETSNLELGYDFSKFEGVRSYSTKAKSASFSNKKTNDFYAKYDWTVNDKDQGFIQLYRNKYDYYNAGDMYETDTGFEAQQNITLSDNNRLVVGASYRKAKALNATSYTAEKSINNKAVFVSDQWEFAPSWTLDTGVRYDKHSTAGQPACGQLSGRDGGPQERCHPGTPRYRSHRPARHLLHVALFQRGDRDPAVHHRRKAHGHHQYRGCHQHRAQPVLNDAADGAGHPHGAGTEYDG